MDTSRIHKQFIDVIASYDMMGVKIFSVVSNGSGGNETFFWKMSNDLHMIELWTNENGVRFVNPVDSNRHVYSLSCSTYSLKVLWNNILYSQH